jgi:hypothetical protein
MYLLVEHGEFGTHPMSVSRDLEKLKASIPAATWQQDGKVWRSGYMDDGQGSEYWAVIREIKEL